MIVASTAKFYKDNKTTTATTNYYNDENKSSNSRFNDVHSSDWLSMPSKNNKNKNSNKNNNSNNKQLQRQQQQQHIVCTIVHVTDFRCLPKQQQQKASVMHCKWLLMPAKTTTTWECNALHVTFNACQLSQFCSLGRNSSII